MDAAPNRLLSAMTNVKEAINMEMQGAEIYVCEDVEEKTSELTILLNQLKVTLGQVAHKLDVLDTVFQSY